MNLRKYLFCLLLILLPLIVTNSYGFKTGKLKGVYHRVKKGETLYSIARAYHIHVQDLAEVNNLDNPNRIEMDRVLFVPDATEVVEDVMLLRNRDYSSPRNKQATEKEPVAKSPSVVSSSVQGGESKTENVASLEPTSPKIPLEPPGITTDPSETSKVVEPSSEEETTAGENIPPSVSSPSKNNNRETPPADVTGKMQFEKKRFVWPVKGRVVSRFGVQPNGMFYNWISINAKEMSPVVAAASGTVIFSAELKDYGETIIIKHADNFATVYTHLKVRKVMLDDSVKKGDSIALVGKLGKEDNVYLNFEVRHQNRARNPLFFLP